MINQQLLDIARTLKEEGYIRMYVHILPPVPMGIILVGSDAVAVCSLNFAAIEASNACGDSLIGLVQLD